MNRWVLKKPLWSLAVAKCYNIYNNWIVTVSQMLRRLSEFSEKNWHNTFKVTPKSYSDTNWTDPENRPTAQFTLGMI